VLEVEIIGGGQRACIWSRGKATFTSSTLRCLCARCRCRRTSCSRDTIVWGHTAFFLSNRTDPRYGEYETFLGNRMLAMQAMHGIMKEASMKRARDFLSGSGARVVTVKVQIILSGRSAAAEARCHTLLSSQCRARCLPSLMKRQAAAAHIKSLSTLGVSCCTTMSCNPSAWRSRFCQLHKFKAWQSFRPPQSALQLRHRHDDLSGSATSKPADAKVADPTIW
jgi:hypothetical protein